MIFVFGSNKAGIHGAGAARFALLKKGAVQGVGEGRTGDSYAIPTKDYRIQTIPLGEIQLYVDDFIKYAKENSELQFQVTKIGCGLAGYCNEQIAPMFKDAPLNCFFDDEWKLFLPHHQNWGTA